MGQIPCIVSVTVRWSAEIQRRPKLRTRYVHALREPLLTKQGVPFVHSERVTTRSSTHVGKLGLTENSGT